MSVESSSMRGLTAGRVLHSRLAWRIGLCVLLAVALPVVVFGLLGGQALQSVSRHFESRERVLLVRTVAAQVRHQRHQRQAHRQQHARANAPGQPTAQHPAGRQAGRRAARGGGFDRHGEPGNQLFPISATRHQP